MVYQRALKHSTIPFQKSLMSKKCFDTISWYVHKTMAYFICFLTLIKTDDIPIAIRKMAVVMWILIKEGRS